MSWLKRASRSEEVLKQLDRCAERFTFPALDNGYIYMADTRMSVYASSSGWAILIEVLGYNPRGGAEQGFDNCIYAFGTALLGKPGIDNDSFIYPISSGPSGPLIAEYEPEIIDSETRDLRIREVVVQIPKNLSVYTSRRIVLHEWPKVAAYELLRYLAPEHRDLLLATEEELYARLAKRIPLILRLDAWQHPDVLRGQKPSRNETFQQIARVIETLDPSLYHPVHPPNTHWSKWPEGGSL